LPAEGDETHARAIRLRAQAALARAERARRRAKEALCRIEASERRKKNLQLEG